MVNRRFPIIFGSNVPAWLRSAYPGMPAPKVALHFDEQRYWAGGNRSLTDILSITRASTKYATTSAGLLVPVSTGQFAIGDGNGLFIDESRTNVVLWNRDLTNAVWTATDVTVAKDQTGADGTANAASSLTATGANGTVLQAITLASSARFQSAFVKRITGSGTIEMTMDNGATWTAITVTASYTRLLIPTQTLANPTVGFRIVTSGDAIAVDFVQNENGTSKTSPIATTTASVTRAADVITATASALKYNNNAATIFASASAYRTNLQDQYLLDASTNDRVLMYAEGSSRNIVYGVQRSGSFSVLATGSGLLANSNDVAFKAAMGFQSNDFQSYLNGTADLNDTSVVVAAPATFYIGGNSLAAGFFNGHIKRMVFWNTRISDASLDAITT